VLAKALDQARQILFVRGSDLDPGERRVLVFDTELELHDLVGGPELDDLVHHLG
jgi:hypothetical protein